MEVNSIIVVLIFILFVQTFGSTAVLQQKLRELDESCSLTMTMDGYDKCITVNLDGYTLGESDAVIEYKSGGTSILFRENTVFGKANYLFKGTCDEILDINLDNLCKCLRKAAGDKEYTIKRTWPRPDYKFKFPICTKLYFSS